MAANDIEIKWDVDEDIMIDGSNLEQFNFFTSPDIVPDDVVPQSTGIELSEIRVPLLKFVKEDDIGMAKVMGSNKTIADKAPLIYICPVCGKKYK